MFEGLVRNLTFKNSCYGRERKFPPERMTSFKVESTKVCATFKEKNINTVPALLKISHSARCSLRTLTYAFFQMLAPCCLPERPSSFLDHVCQAT